MKLLIVESPAKAKTISKYLDNEYTVRASVGHIRDLPKSNKKAISIEGGFVPHYEIVKGKEKVVSELKALAERADEIVLATDLDREGEAIAWHLSELFKKGVAKNRGRDSSGPLKRITYSEITKEAIREALKHPRTIDQNLRKAQEARRVLDRLVGYDLSGLIWKKLRYGLSAGRVQSPALRIIVEREREIKAFKPEKFWVITANVKNKEAEFSVVCSEEPREKEQVNKIVSDGEKGQWYVKDIVETKAGRSPRPPFITSTLQQSASTRLGFTPARTMGVAQKLYENGHITYMRTDSTNLSKQALGYAASVIEKKFGKNLVQIRTYAKKSKNAQEAHEAIRPTNLAKEKISGNDDQKRLYELIWQRAIASQMADAEILRTKITANIKSDSVPDFAINGSRVISAGWLLADPRARGDDVELPKVTKGEDLDLLNIGSEEKETEPPSRFSEAGLVKELEKRGIGRPSTYASIIKTLEDRGYVEKQNKALVPTDTGEVVSSFLEKHFSTYISDDFTAHMEDDLDDIANGDKEYRTTLENFYTPFSKDVKAKENIEKINNLGLADKKFKCPTCGGSMIIKLGKTGKFLSCEKFPDCSGALMMDGHEIKVDEPIGKHPETGEDIYLLTGRFGPYVQLGLQEKGKNKPKARKASIPKDKDLGTVTVEDAAKYLSLPRKLGKHPKTDNDISSNIGRFGPYIVHDGDFRSLKGADNPYEITLERALQILSEPKKARFGRKKKE
ncbi:MAG: type I DNA topoisomerase [bacterium]|nr:type I DNA topoisomerase [bacterium]